MNNITQDRYPYSKMLDDFLQQKHPEYDQFCNRQMLLDNCEKPISSKNFEATLSKIRGRLALSTVTCEALQEFFDKHSEYSGVQANKQLLLELFGGQPSLESFEEVASRQPCPLAINAKAQGERAQQQHRENMLAAIANGKKEYTVIGPNGNQRVYQIADLISESTSFIENVHSQVLAYRQARARTPSEGRKELRSLHEAPNDYPRLPDTFIMPNGQSIPLDASFLRRIDNEHFRKFVRLYGEQNVMNRWNSAAGD